MYPLMRLCTVTALMLLSTSCSLYSTATRWNGRADSQGRPLFVKTSTNIGFNLGIILPVLGDTTIDEMVDVTTAEIARFDSDGVRVFQTTSENYWYGFPPFTWVVTPVITTIAIEYNPSPAEMRDAEVDIRVYERNQEARRKQAEAAADAAATGR